MTFIGRIRNDKSLLADNWFVTAGSITGSEHLRLGRNNQDGVCIDVSERRLTAVVTDGCSMGRYSEVGARLGARWLASWIDAHLDLDGPPDVALHELCEGLTDHLRLLLRGMRRAPGSDADLIADYLLFTFLVVTIDRRHARIFGVGDGFFAVNGAPTALDPGAGNAPPYIGYTLVEPDRLIDPPPTLSPVLHRVLPTCDVDSIVIGTDGLADLEPATLDALSADDRYLQNPMHLQRQLNVASRRLADDTTAVIIRRRSGR